MITNDNDGYNAEANSYECWKLAIRSMRLDEIRAGRATPRTDDPEEMEAAREAGFKIVDAQTHRRSA
jgi:hypothetical protein